MGPKKRVTGTSKDKKTFNINTILGIKPSTPENDPFKDEITIQD
jgi:hypothetical protein